MIQYSLKFFIFLKKLFSNKISLREKLVVFFQNQEINLSNEQLQMILNVVPLIRDDIDKVKTSINKVVSINIKTSFKETVLLLQKTGHSRIPVYEEKDGHRVYVGILYSKDLIGVHFEKIGRFTLKDYMRPIYFSPQTQKLLSLLREMRLKKNHLSMVVNEYGTVTGIITLEDILEEIVGDIHDEFDKASKLIQEIDAKQYRVSADILLTILNKELAINLPDEKFHTLAGYLLHELQGNIQKNKEILYGSVVLKIEKCSGQQIDQVIIKLSAPSDTSLS